MKTIRKTTQFKKDFKKIKNNTNKINALLEIVRKLANGETIPAEFDPHPLTGH